MTATNLVIEDGWMVIESQRVITVSIKTNYGTIYKRVMKDKLLRHPLVQGMSYRVEIYGSYRVIVTTKVEEISLSYYKRGGIFCCEFHL